MFFLATTKLNVRVWLFRFFLREGRYSGRARIVTFLENHCSLKKAFAYSNSQVSTASCNRSFVFFEFFQIMS